MKFVEVFHRDWVTQETLARIKSLAETKGYRVRFVSTNRCAYQWQPEKVSREMWETVDDSGLDPVGAVRGGDVLVLLGTRNDHNYPLSGIKVLELECPYPGGGLIPQEPGGRISGHKFDQIADLLGEAITAYDAVMLSKELILGSLIEDLTTHKSELETLKDEYGYGLQPSFEKVVDVLAPWFPLTLEEAADKICDDSLEDAINILIGEAEEQGIDLDLEYQPANPEHLRAVEAAAKALLEEARRFVQQAIREVWV